MLYRFEHNGQGIYGAVDKFCPRNGRCRENKPDGSWLPKVGPRFPNAISFWTETGLDKYIRSGLLAWHLSVLPNEVTVQYCQLIDAPQYQDKYQVLSTPENVIVLSVESATKYFDLDL